MPEHTSISAEPQVHPNAANEVKVVGQPTGKDIYTHSLSRLPIQRKLTIGVSDDPLEDEADHMADKVMRMPDQSFIQRKCDHCEQKEKAQREPFSLFIQKKQSLPISSTVASDSISSQIQSTMGNGNPMPQTTKSFMESRFGTDFSKINIHTDNYATDLSNQLNAHAFTVGNDIYFNEGKYCPESNIGKHLLAHELMHTIQQTGSIQRDSDKTPKVEDDVDLKALRKNITDGHWKDTFTYLNRQWMKVMLEKLNTLTESELNKLIDNADAARNAKDSHIGEGGKKRTLAGVWAVKAFKNTGLTGVELGIAEENLMTIPHEQRKEIVAFLKPGTSKAAKKLATELNKPFFGYTASGYDFSKRFFKQSDKLGFDVESNAKKLPTTKWGRRAPDPDPQTQDTTNEATKSFETSNIIFFSGHQYAQYGNKNSDRTGLYTNEASESCFNISAISKKLDKVKLVASTSCATICKDVAVIYKAKFPHALVLGYKYSAPSNGEKVADSFGNYLVKKGPIDLDSPAGLNDVKDAWKKATTSNPGAEGAPGILSGDYVETFEGGKWKTVKADSKDNACHYH